MFDLRRFLLKYSYIGNILWGSMCLCGHLTSWAGMKITMNTMITLITRIRKTSNLALVLAISTVWAPDQLGGGWGREDGGRGFGLGGHSTVDSMPQGPRLNPALSSISCQGWEFFRLTFGVREGRERFGEHDFFPFQPCFQAKTTGSGRWTCSSWPL